jgi:hypothetical protein
MLLQAQLACKTHLAAEVYTAVPPSHEVQPCQALQLSELQQQTLRRTLIH